MNLWGLLGNARFQLFVLAVIILVGGGYLAHLHPDWWPTIISSFSGIIGSVGSWMALRSNGNGTYTNGGKGTG